MKTRKEINATKRKWYKNNQEKCRLMALKSYLKHKEKRNAESKAWAENNKERVKQYHKEYNPIWYQKNKENHDQRGKEWGKSPENKKKRVKYVQKYVAKNKEKVNAYGKEYNMTYEGRYRTTKSSASKRGKSFNLSLEEFSAVVSQPCTYCGESKKIIGIDRVDNLVGYTKENSSPCCSMCNYFKKNYTLKEFLIHIKKIYLHNVKRK